VRVSAVRNANRLKLCRTFFRICVIHPAAVLTTGPAGQIADGNTRHDRVRLAAFR
jgi:hypothetical protein